MRLSLRGLVIRGTGTPVSLMSKGFAFMALNFGNISSGSWSGRGLRIMMMRLRMVLGFMLVMRLVLMVGMGLIMRLGIMIIG